MQHAHFCFELQGSVLFKVYKQGSNLYNLSVNIPLCKMCDILSQYLERIF